MRSSKMKPYILTLVILSVIFIDNTHAASNQTEFYCSTDYVRITSLTGKLIIQRNNSSCGFMSKDDTQVFAIKTDTLKLHHGDSVEIRSDRQTNGRVFRPPFDSGYIFSGLKEPSIVFNFTNRDDTVMEVDFLQDIASLPLDSDINNDFQITPLEISTLKLEVSKTIPEMVHLEVLGANLSPNTASGGKIAEGVLNHILIPANQTNLTVPVYFNQNSHTVRIKTSPAFSNCSGQFINTKNDHEHEIIGPDANFLNQKYKCVNLFTSAIGGNQAHYEVDFKNFSSLADSEDVLILEDDLSNSRIRIDKSNADQYINQVVVFKGNKLAVTYESPRAITPSKIPFKLQVRAVEFGGLIDKSGVLTLPSGATRIKYVLKPDPQQVATIEFLEGTKLKDLSLEVTTGAGQVATFQSGSYLPPILTANEPNTLMTLVLSGKDVSKLNPVKFYSLQDSCHKISTTLTGFSAQGDKSPCYWTILTNKTVNLKIDYNNLDPSGCLTIKSLTQDKTIYSKCNIKNTNIFPPFNVQQVFVNVSLPSNKTRFEATLSSVSSLSNTILQPQPEVNIVSQGYPVVYAWSSLTQSYILNGTNRSYVLSVNDVDLRSGEILMNGNVPLDLMNSLMAVNTTLNITIDRKGSDDFGHHRGFNLTAKEFDKILVTNTTRNQIITPKNHTNLFVKISSEISSRISYNITFKTTNNNFGVLLIDGRKIGSRTPYSEGANYSIYHGSTSSDTLMIMYSVNKINTTLPEMVIDYKPIACNTTRGDYICDNKTRCVPVDWLCKGFQQCDDGSDLRLKCSSGPAPQPQIIDDGYAGITVFILSVFMLSLGAVIALFGPGLYKALETRFRSSQYSAFVSVE